MKKFLKDLTIPKKLALVAIVLGLLATIAGSPYSGSTIKVNAKDLALSTVNNSDKIEVLELADWIIKGKSDYTLVDLREEKDFNEYFIPTAYNIPMETLPEAGLLRNQKIILYCYDDLRAAQAWFILKSDNYRGVYILNGGLDKWKSEVLFPNLSADAGKEQIAEFEKIKEISKFFGGVPQTGAEETVDKKTDLPTPQITTQPSITKPKKKKREGC
ncbi:MAG: rhodanese-like domain-containing protein [bacterium]|nr:rhodanese-like domain-containing protein [bacterium]